MRSFARLLQLIGLMALPLGMVLQLGNSISLGQMLLVMIAGASAFWIGWIVEGYAKKS